MDDKFSEFTETTENVTDVNTDVDNDIKNVEDEPLDLTRTSNPWDNVEITDDDKELNDLLSKDPNIKHDMKKDNDENVNKLDNKEDKGLDMTKNKENKDNVNNETKDNVKKENKDNNTDVNLKDDNKDRDDFLSNLRSQVNTGPHLSDLEDKPKSETKEEDDDDQKIRVKGDRSLVR